MTAGRYATAATLLVLAALAALYFAVDPSESTWLPKCPMHMLTGLECAGCGSQRAIHALLHGDIAAAWSFNPLLIILLPYLLALAYVELIPRKSGSRLYALLHHHIAIYIVIALIIAWTLVRNILP